jgi:hypothetical protein
MSSTWVGEERVAPMTDDRDGRGSNDDVRTDFVAYLVVAVPDRAQLAALVPALAAMVDAARISILDLVVVARDHTGVIRIEEIEDVESLAALRRVEGEVGGLLTEVDARNAARALGPDDVGIVLLAEQRWALPLSEAAHQVGGHIVAGERVSRERVEAALREVRKDG